MLRFKNRNHLYVVSVIFLFLFLAGCSNKPKELAPFFDGLFLKYTRESSIKREIAFNVEALSDGEFQIIETATPKLIGDKIDKMQVDRFGRVYKSTFEPYEGKFSPIWIPVTKLKINGKFDGRKKLVRIEPWREWEVAVVKDIPTGAESYYDSSTGYLVGGFAKTPLGPVEEYLVETNADLSVVENE